MLTEQHVSESDSESVTNEEAGQQDEEIQNLNAEIMPADSRPRLTVADERVFRFTVFQDALAQSENTDLMTPTTTNPQHSAPSRQDENQPAEGLCQQLQSCFGLLLHFERD